MTGSHEVRGSIPLGSTNSINNLQIAVQRSFAIRLRMVCERL